MANNYGFTFGELNDSSANDGYGGLFVKFLNTVGSNSAGTKQPALLFDMRDSGTPIDWTNITSPLLINGNGLAINSDSPPASGYALHVNTGNLKVESSSNNTQLELLASGGTNQTYKIFSATSSNSNGAGLYFQDATADTIPLSIKSSNGYVGIGTTSPGAGLHVVNNGKNIRMEGTDHCYMEFYPDGNAAGRKGYFGFPNGTATDIFLVNQMGGLRFQIDSGDIYFNRDGSWQSASSNSSDSRIKENIVEYPPADSLNIVKNIKVKKYYQTQEKKECRGFIAQEITDYVPEAVSIHDLSDAGLQEDYHMLDYRRVLVHSFGAIQELDRIKTEQEGRIQTLETQLADVLTRLEALENP